MQLSRHDTRALAVLALVTCAALFSIECGDYFLRRVDDVTAVGHQPTEIREFGAGVPISQSFTVRRDHVHSMTIAISSDQPAVIGFEFTLVRKGAIADWPDEPITKRPIQMSLPAGITQRTIDFEPVVRSKDRIFVATFHLTDVMRRGSSAEDPKVALSAWSDDAFRGGSLRVGTDDRWGDLAFSAQVDPPTRLRRFSNSVKAATALPFGSFTFIGVTLVYAILIGIVCTVGVHRWRVEDSPVRVKEAAVVGPAEWPLLTSLRMSAATILALATAILFVAIFLSRERASAVLIDQLDTAKLESPLGMHGGFSLVEEVINGSSPPALFAHPPSRITWKVAVPATSPMLKTTVALRPTVWEHRTDGASFEIGVSDGERVTRTTRFLSPGNNLNDRAWLEMDVDLAPYAGKTVEISLETGPGPMGNPAWDWALWGNPRVISRGWIDRYGRASRVLNRARSGD